MWGGEGRTLRKVNPGQAVETVESDGEWVPRTGKTQSWAEMRSQGLQDGSQSSSPHSSKSETEEKREQGPSLGKGPLLGRLVPVAGRPHPKPQHACQESQQTRAGLREEARICRPPWGISLAQ